MNFSQLQLKTSLSIVVFLMSALTLAAVAFSWYNQGQIADQIQSVATSGSQAGASLGSLTQEVEASFSQSRLVLGGLAVLALVLGFASFLVLSRMVLRPLKRVGDVFEHIASGDLTQRIEAPSENEIGMLYLALKRMQDSLNRIVGTVRAGMHEINIGSQQIVSGNTDLSGRTEQQAAALQETAASLEQLASTVKQNADNARQANQLAATASEVAQRGGHAVGEVVSTMHGISASSRKISDIVGVIDSIAFQTNILALNAAVEAARAGEQGKGFAVVASEVRALAQRSAQAAKEIKGLIDDSVKKVAEGSEQVERAGATMEEIVTSVARVTDIMGEISAATTEQSSGIDQINRAVSQMDQVTQHNAVLVEEAAASAATLGQQVSSVTGAVAIFKTSGSEVIDVAAKQLASSSPRPAVSGHSAAGERRSSSATAALGHSAADKGQQASAEIRVPGLKATAAQARAHANGPVNGKTAQNGNGSAARAGQTVPKQNGHQAAASSRTPRASESAPPSYVMKSPGQASRSAAGDDDWVEF